MKTIGKTFDEPKAKKTAAKAPAKTAEEKASVKQKGSKAPAKTAEEKASVKQKGSKAPAKTAEEKAEEGEGAETQKVDETEGEGA